MSLNFHHFLFFQFYELPSVDKFHCVRTCTHRDDQRLKNNRNKVKGHLGVHQKETLWLTKMPGGGFSIEGGGNNYEGRVTLFVVLACIVATSGGLLFGYDIGISGGVTSMDTFLNKFFPEVIKKMKNNSPDGNNMYCKFESQILTLFTSSLYLSALVASFFASS